MEKEHTRKKGKSITQKHKTTKTISPKLPLFSIHPHNTQSHSQSHHSSSSCHIPIMYRMNKERTTCSHPPMVSVSASSVCVIEHLVHVLWWWLCWLCLKPFITMIDDVTCCCEKRLMLFESLRDGIIRICPSEPFESTNNLLSMVCAQDASVKKGSAIGTSLIQHSLHQCTCPVFCFTLCMSTKPLHSNLQCDQ